MFVSSRWQVDIVTWGVDPTNQAIWTLFEINGKPFVIINIYASNFALDRCNLWRWLAMNLLEATWILCGDFNMVEKGTDKKSFSPMRWCVGEREAFYFLKNKLSLSDHNVCFSVEEFPKEQWLTWPTHAIKKR